jgi:hypothetical protein
MNNITTIGDLIDYVIKHQGEAKGQGSLDAY